MTSHPLHKKINQNFQHAQKHTEKKQSDRDTNRDTEINYPQELFIKRQFTTPIYGFKYRDLFKYAVY